MAFEKSEGGVEKGDGALGGFIREELCEGEARVVIDGDVETLGAVAGIGVLGVAREAVTRLDKAGELLDVEMNEVARRRVLIAADGRRRAKSGESAGMSAEDAGHRSL